MKFEASKELTTYFREIEKKAIPLTKAEEEVVLPLAKGGNSKAVARVVESCAKYVVKIANKYMGQGVPVIDLVQEGNLGTIEAIGRFDKESKTRFITYAALWIRKYINDSVATHGRIVRLPMHHEFEIFKLKKSGEEVENLKTVRLDDPVGDEGNATLGDIYLKVNAEVYDEQDKEEEAIAVNFYLNKITNERDREIVKAYFGIDREYALPGKELSKEFGLSQVRISQIVNRTIDKIRK